PCSPPSPRRVYQPTIGAGRECTVTSPRGQRLVRLASGAALARRVLGSVGGKKAHGMGPVGLKGEKSLVHFFSLVQACASHFCSAGFSFFSAGFSAFSSGSLATFGAGAAAGRFFCRLVSPSLSSSRKAVCPASPSRRSCRLITRV